MTAATSPRVNLMPPEIAEAARFRQIQALLGAGIGLAVVVVALLYLNAHNSVSSAQTELDQAVQQQASLQTKLDSLASVAQTFAAVEARQAMLSQAMGSEVRWSGVLSDLSIRMPSNVWLTGLTVTETPATAAAPASAQTLGGTAPAASAPVAIGTLTFSAFGLKHDDVAAWLDAMAKEPKFSNPAFTSSTETAIGAHPAVNFSGTVTLNSTALSGRYAPPAGAAAPASTAPATSAPATDDGGISTVPGTGIAAP
jgi:Tfp pilus assembly protein PilN